ncbi:MAG: RNA-guided endonuclease InsQ/TnpB family protein [Candidatus Hodarchaeales archaeon]|jgi:putative transposase
MLLTRKIKLLINNKQRELLERLAFACTKLHNTANWERQQQWRKTGKIPSYAKQCVVLKDNHWYKLLHSQSAQAILQKLDFSYKSWYKLRKHDTKARPPGYRPKTSLSTILFKKVGFRVLKSKLRLSLSKKLREELAFPDRFLWLSFASYREIKGQPRTLEIKLIDGKWYGYIVEKLATVEPDLSERPKIIAIDQGIINLAGCITSDGKTFLFTGKGLLSMQRYFNKQLATVQHRVQSRAKKHAWSTGLTALHRKRGYQPDHALHALAKALVEYCKASGIAIIVIGKLTGIRQDKQWGDKGNQKLHAWSYKKLAEYLSYKAEAAGIKLETVSERNTSKTCSTCGKKGKRVKRGLFTCNNNTCSQYGIGVNADLNGARNILNRYLRAASSSRSGKVLVGPLAAPVVKRWNFHCWSTVKWIIKPKRKPVTRASPSSSDHKTGDILVKESPLI